MVNHRFKILHPHTAVETSDASWDVYHEWVRRDHDVNDCEMLDSIGRRNNGGYRWDYWCCNNLDCSGLALVNATEVDNIISDWLSAAAPS